MVQYPSLWVLKHYISVEFWPFQVIFRKIFLVNRAQTPCECGGIDEFNIPLNFHHTCFSWIVPSTLSLCSLGLCCQTRVMCSSGHSVSFLGKEIFWKLMPTPHPWWWRIWSHMGFLYRSWHPIQFLAKIALEKTPLPHSTCEALRIGKHYFSKHIWAHHVIANTKFSELTCAQAHTSEPEVQPTPKEHWSWHH